MEEILMKERIIQEMKQQGAGDKPIQQIMRILGNNQQAQEKMMDYLISIRDREVPTMRAALAAIAFIQRKRIQRTLLIEFF